MKKMSSLFKFVSKIKSRSLLNRPAPSPLPTPIGPTPITPPRLSSPATTITRTPRSVTALQDTAMTRLRFQPPTLPTLSMELRLLRPELVRGSPSFPDLTANSTFLVSRTRFVRLQLMTRTSKATLPTKAALPKVLVPAPARPPNLPTVPPKLMLREKTSRSTFRRAAGSRWLSTTLIPVPVILSTG